MNERTCNRCNKALVGRQAKYCSHACANRDTLQRKSETAQSRPWNSCKVGGCQKRARSRVADLCPMHYHRQYRYGTLERTRDLVQRGILPRTGADLAGQRYGTLTATTYQDSKWVCKCDCGATRIVSVGELNRTGDANTCGIAGRHLPDTVDYSAAHDRVHRARGKADRYPCVDCGRTAQHWSYDHADPDERTSIAPRTAGVAFSLHVEHYEPRCVSCHKRFDMGRINSAEHAA